MDLGNQNRAKLVPKWDQKSISTLKAENQLNASRLAFSWLSGVEVGSKNRPKIDPRWSPRYNATWYRYLDDFWLILEAKLEASWP